MAAKRPDLIDRENWDWSLSNCKLAKMYGVAPASIRRARLKLGIPKYTPGKQEKQLGVDRLHVKHPPIPLSVDKLDPKWVQKFIRIADQHANNESCWLWTGPLFKGGYGKISMKFLGGLRSRQCHLHRISFAILKGAIPPGLLVQHSCDVKACFNPAHLSLGTDLTNSRDASQKGLMHPGIRTFGARLNDDIVRQIKKMRDDGIGVVAISKEVGFHRRTVSDVYHNKTWRHI